MHPRVLKPKCRLGHTCSDILPFALPREGACSLLQVAAVLEGCARRGVAPDPSCHYGRPATPPFRSVIRYVSTDVDTSGFKSAMQER